MLGAKAGKWETVFFHNNSFAEGIRELGFSLHILWFAYKLLLLMLFKDVKTWKKVETHFFLRTIKCLRGRGSIVYTPSLFTCHPRST